MPAGYGAADVIIGRTLVGQVAVTGVQAVPALSPRIRFRLLWTLGHRYRSGEPDRPEGEYRLIDYGGELSVGAGSVVVATMVRAESWRPIGSLPYVHTQESSAAFDLGDHRLERLEEHRAGGVLSLSMQLWLRVEMGGTTTDATVGEIRFQVPRDDWLAVVGTFTGEQIDLLEVRYHLAYANRYRSSLAELKRAREAVDRGSFDSAVMQARKAVSLMEESVRAATQGDLKAALADRLDKEHAELYTSHGQPCEENGQHHRAPGRSS